MKKNLPRWLLCLLGMVLGSNGAAAAVPVACDLPAGKVPEILLVGEVHTDKSAKEANRFLLGFAREGKVQVASEVALSEPNNLTEWHTDARHNPNVFAIENPVLHGLTGSMFLLAQVFTQERWEEGEFAARLCAQAYENPYSRLVLRKMARLEPGLSGLAPWVQRIAELSRGSTYVLDRVERECRGIRHEAGFFSGFTPLQLARLYPYHYFGMLREEGFHVPLLVEGIELYFPREASREYALNRAMDSNIFFAARERYFNRNLCMRLRDAVKRQSPIPFIVLAGELHMRGFEEFFDANRIHYRKVGHMNSALARLRKGAGAD